MLATVATENIAKGAIFLIVTTNLDTATHGYRDMGRIASIGSTGSVGLCFGMSSPAFSEHSLAFSPILIGAEANGHRFEEMHVDFPPDRA